MARYVTPAKIGLLALIELYVSEAMPSEAVIPVLSFITSNLTDRDTVSTNSSETPRWLKAERTFSLVVTIKDFEKLLGSYPFLLGVPGRKLWDQFLGKLWGISSLDGLHKFIGTLSSLLVDCKKENRQEAAENAQNGNDIKLSKSSLFGSFIRRIQVELGRLRWHDTVELWKDFVTYRQPTAHYLRRRLPNFSRLSFDSVLMTGEQGDWGHDGVSALSTIVYGGMLTSDGMDSLAVSTDDIETLLEFQIEQMQKYGGRVPLEIQHQFSDLLRDSFLVPSLTHYLHYLDAWRAGDYPTAFDLLYRYFDYTMQTRDRLFYQYALMNLAVLQAEFGCYKEAVTAMVETVSTARENRDLTCLNFALNWLYQFGRAHPERVRDLDSNSMLGSDKESLAFLRVKAKEMGMWTLWSSVLLSEAKLALMKGDSVATTFESIVRGSQILVERNVKNLFGPQLLLSAAVWERMGIAQQSTKICRIFLRCHAASSNFDDELKFTCQLAFMLVGEGKYDEALHLLSTLDANSLRSSKSCQYWLRYKGLIRLQRDICHGNLTGAEVLLHQLLQSNSEDVEQDLRFHFHAMQLDYLSRTGHLQAAYHEIDAKSSTSEVGNSDVTMRVNLLLWKTHLLNQAGRPQRGFSIAMKAANMAWRARLMPFLWQAIGAIANILTAMGEFDAASQLLDAVIPRALECQTLAVVGRLFSYLADSNMGLAGSVHSTSPRRGEYMASALRAVSKAFDHYFALEDLVHQREMMAKKAMIMKLSGDNVLAADYAAVYVSLNGNDE